MIDWAIVYQRVMSEFQGGRLVPHVIILSGFIVAGLILGVYQNLNLIFLVWAMGVFVDYLLFGSELAQIFTKKRPYTIEGIVQQRVLKKITDEKTQKEKYYFIIEVHSAYILDKDGLSAFNYVDKEGEQKIEVPETMLLSLKTGQQVHLVCDPADKAWGIVRGEEVIFIEE